MFKELLFEYENEILMTMAICKDFKISYSKVFKDKELLNFVYDLDGKNKQYKDVYYIQKAYNEIFKKYSGIVKCLNNGFKKILINVYNIYEELAILFNCDIIKLISAYKKDVKKCEK